MKDNNDSPESIEETAVKNMVTDMVTTIDTNTKNFTKAEGQILVVESFTLSICAYMDYLGIETEGEGINDFIYKLNQEIIKTYPALKKEMDTQKTGAGQSPLLNTLDTALRLSQLAK